MKAWRNLGNKQVMKKNKGRKEGYMVGWKKGRDESLKKRCKKSFDVGFFVGVYERGRIFEWPGIRKAYRVRIS